jgi:hypothetical protein
LRPDSLATLMKVNPRSALGFVCVFWLPPCEDARSLPGRAKPRTFSNDSTNAERLRE